MVIINTRPALPNAGADVGSQPGDYHIIPVSRVQSFQIVSLAGSAESGDTTFANAQPPIGPVDTRRLKEREQAKINKLREDERNKGKGVTKEAQAIFDSFRRMYVINALYQFAHERKVIDNLVATCPSAGITRR